MRQAALQAHGFNGRTLISGVFHWGSQLLSSLSASQCVSLCTGTWVSISSLQAQNNKRRFFLQQRQLNGSTSFLCSYMPVCKIHSHVILLVSLYAFWKSYICVQCTLTISNISPSSNSSQTLPLSHVSQISDQASQNPSIDGRGLIKSLPSWAAKGSSVFFRDATSVGLSGLQRVAINQSLPSAMWLFSLKPYSS